MTGIALAFLVVYLFGLLAYGSSLALSLRSTAPVWSPNRADLVGGRRQIDRVSAAMFLLCTVWFALHVVLQLRRLSGIRAQGWIDVAALALAFLFPPLIMHVVFLESGCDERPAPAPVWRHLLTAMYVISPAIGLWVMGIVFDYFPAPPAANTVVSASVGGLFTLASAYSAAVMTRHRRPSPTPDQRKLRTAMLTLFAIVTSAFLLAMMLDDRRAVTAVLDGGLRSTPIFFLVVAVYFENRFEFYDLVIKRGVLLVPSLLMLAAVFTLVLPWIDTLPATSPKPWLAAVALVPAVMLLPWLYSAASRGMDRLWFGRTFTAVDAVKHLLGAMRPATDERSLIAATESRLVDIVGSPVVVVVDGDAPPDLDPGLEVSSVSPSGSRVRFSIASTPGARPVLSEDLTLLRSLAGVFGFMLENIRLQQKRQEQELVAQELRLQTSRSELKALRAQINPHFLFNALNAIASLIHTDPTRADEAVEQLAEVFRYTLRRSDSEWAPLDQELAFARAYLDVERARFGARLTCVIDSDHLPPVPQVPSMLLQTLIENAVKHGVSQTRGVGHIDLIVRTTSSDVVMEVRDNGPGPGAPGMRPRDGEGFGLRSVRERLAGHFGDRASLTLVRDEARGLTIARIEMPRARVAA
jgi:hypothetical protein